jgi:hypothetical protein
MAAIMATTAAVEIRAFKQKLERRGSEEFGAARVRLASITSVIEAP